MDPDRTIDDRPPDESPREPGVLDDIQSLWHELRGLSHDRIQLAALETQRAGLNLVDMVAAGVSIAVLLIVAWLGWVAAAVLWLIENGLAVSSALLLAAAGNLLFAVVLAAAIRRKSQYLAFPAILRSLEPIPPKQETGKPS
ncbi:phage holin family protein [Methylomonas koyamae]|uniref:phage holin family protein n=1 Tax=Methylomonas koyamae TaxID=702114 RepID=UPI000BC2C534|nr:phage holin family protein [Methylomonas koyamae]ATG90136.1 hypothetical protein MKLM6_1903 [Methylomonas koyamae]